MRDGEAEFLACLLEGLESGDCRVVEISGDPGTGKTHLLDHVEGRAVELGVPVSRHTCAPAGQPSSFRPTTLSSARPGDLVLVDDFQHADPAAVEAFHEFLRQRPSHPMLVVVAHRPRQTPLRLRSVLAGAARLGRLDRIELGPLSVHQAAVMLGLPCEDSRVRRWHEASGGIPLYLGVLADRSMTPEPLADTRRHRTAALEEIAALRPDDVDVLAAAAVLGQDIDVSTLAAVAEVDTATASAAVARLVNADLLRRLGEGQIVPRHRVLGELIHDSLDPGFRTGAHRRAAEVLFRHTYDRSIRELTNLDVEGIFSEVEHLVRDLPFQMPQDLIYLGRSVGMVAGMATTLDSDINLFETLRRVKQPEPELSPRWQGQALTARLAGFKVPVWSVAAVAAVAVLGLYFIFRALLGGNAEASASALLLSGTCSSASWLTTASMLASGSGTSITLPSSTRTRSESPVSAVSSAAPATRAGVSSMPVTSAP